ncbi:rubrerythrin family protein [Dorea sp. D27]|uniref:rubrerythrin family protein n=1 Tax=Dorea sp. D27 TaxID=658665 RepID=UPI00067358E3|nr:rubrerythrin family protein [Dorea sp. D27]KMZ54290.1 rubrerythrin [Dorea sp. D27]
MDLKDSKTYENLKTALSGESLARNKYTYFAQAARRDGHEHIAEELEAMAVNEMTHARFWFELIYGKPVDVLTNLQIAMKGEYDEWNSMYPEFAKKAREEGFEDIAVMFEHVASIEKSHEERFMKLFIEAKKSESSADQEPAAPAEEVPSAPEYGYRCVFCGAVFPNRPDVCSVCKAIGSFDHVEVH